jgi:hypothetical protein
VVPGPATESGSGPIGPGRRGADDRNRTRVFSLGSIFTPERVSETPARGAERQGLGEGVGLGGWAPSLRDDADRRRWWRGCSCSRLLAERRGKSTWAGRWDERAVVPEAATRMTYRDSRTTRPPDSGRRCTAGGGRRPSKRKRPPAPPSVTPIRLKLHYSYCLGQSRRRSLASIPSRRPSHAVGHRGSTPWPGRHRRVPPARRPDTREPATRGRHASTSQLRAARPTVGPAT